MEGAWKIMEDFWDKIAADPDASTTTASIVPSQRNVAAPAVKAAAAPAAKKESKSSDFWDSVAASDAAAPASIAPQVQSPDTNIGPQKTYPHSWVDDVADTVKSFGRAAYRKVAPLIPGTPEAAQAGQGMVDFAKQVITAPQHPVDTANKLIDAYKDLISTKPQAAVRAEEAWKKGNHVEAFNHMVGALLENAMPGTGVGEGLSEGTQIANDTSKPLTERIGGSLGTAGTPAAMLALGGKTEAAAEGLQAAQDAVAPTIKQTADALKGVPRSVVDYAKDAIEKRQIANEGGPLQAIQKGIRPRSSAINFDKDLAMAAPDINAAQAELGSYQDARAAARSVQLGNRPSGSPLIPNERQANAINAYGERTPPAVVKAPKNIGDNTGEAAYPGHAIDDTLNAIAIGKQKVWNQIHLIESQADQAGTMLDTTPIADRANSQIPQTMWRENPEAAQAIKDKNDSIYRGKFMSVPELERAIQEWNAQGDSIHYSKYPHQQRSMLLSDPEGGQVIRKVEAARDILADGLQSVTGDDSLSQLKRRYGALSSVERELYPRRNVAVRQQPFNLAQQLVGGSAAADLGLGIMTGHPVVGLAAGMARKEITNYLKELGTTDSLLTRGFRNYRELPNDPTRPMIAAPRDTSGPIPAAARDFSSVGSEYAPQQKLLAPSTLPFSASGVAVPDIAGQSQLAANRMNAGPRQLPPSTLPFSANGTAMNASTLPDAARQMNIGPRQLPAPVPGMPPINILPTREGTAIGPAGTVPMRSTETPLPARGTIGEGMRMADILKPVAREMQGPNYSNVPQRVTPEDIRAEGNGTVARKPGLKVVNGKYYDAKTGKPWIYQGEEVPVMTRARGGFIGGRPSSNLPPRITPQSLR